MRIVVDFPAPLGPINATASPSSTSKETLLTAKYGERFDELQRIEVKYDVVVITADSEKMYTDHLIWDERANRIYSDVFIKIITPDKIIWGDGFESDERFSQYRILRPKGEIQIKEDKID